MWKDLSIAQRSQWINKLRPYMSLSEMRQFYDASVPSMLPERLDPYLQYATAPMYAYGGHRFDGNSEPTQRKRFNNGAYTLDAYKAYRAQQITDAAVKNALSRTKGVAPIINGQALSSCAYTATDNWGAKRRIASSEGILRGHGKNGWELAGPLSENEDSTERLYIMIDKNGKPYHTNVITGQDANGKPLITYSRGHANGLPVTMEEYQDAVALQRQFNPRVQPETWEEFRDRVAKTRTPEADYKKNNPVWNTPYYETVKFVGTPEDQAQWEKEFNALEGYIDTPIVPVQIQTPMVQQFKKGGHKIHINPKNKGKFNATKKRTGKTTEELTHSKNPVTRKRAVFAQNAAKWHKKSHGGIKF